MIEPSKSDKVEKNRASYGFSTEPVDDEASAFALFKSKREKEAKARESYGFPNEPIVDDATAFAIFKQAATANASALVFQQAATAQGEGASKLWEEKPIPGTPSQLWDGGKRAEKASGLNGISFVQLYLFLWKLALASAAFALPFIILYVIVTAK